MCDWRGVRVLPCLFFSLLYILTCHSLCMLPFFFLLTSWISAHSFPHHTSHLLLPLSIVFFLYASFTMLTVTFPFSHICMDGPVFLFSFLLCSNNHSSARVVSPLTKKMCALCVSFKCYRWETVVGMCFP